MEVDNLWYQQNSHESPFRPVKHSPSRRKLFAIDFTIYSGLFRHIHGVKLLSLLATPDRRWLKLKPLRI